MDAVLRIDDKVWVLSIGFAGNFIDACRAVTCFRGVINGQIELNGNCWIAEFEMGGLVFFVVGIGQEYRREPVETDHPIGFRVQDFCAFSSGMQCPVIGMIMKCPGSPAP